MDLYRIEKYRDKVLIRSLGFYPTSWSGYQWVYQYIQEGGYPTEISYATDFKTIENAEKWIREHQPK